MTIESEREEFIRAFDVSHETLAQFDRYAAMLAEWQERINLIAPSTLPHIWNRHFYDSAQLLAHIPKDAKTIVDIGSGAGFPGMVLALLGMQGVHLIEATQKKAKFLTAVAEELKIPVTVHAARADSALGLRADVMTARAVAPLTDLLPLCRHFRQRHTVILLLKGVQAGEELTKARQAWHFDAETVMSRTSDSGKILILNNLLHRREVSHDRTSRRR
ncbi:MAG: 16S rRNA (guanine(527)-N(7))-methyltransferase RsmG [Alphaproteobacteria bacterium]